VGRADGRRSTPLSGALPSTCTAARRARTKPAPCARPDLQGLRLETIAAPSDPERDRAQSLSTCRAAFFESGPGLRVGLGVAQAGLLTLPPRANPF
jgi:hypothetical protein